jgi:hypothetical protein
MSAQTINNTRSSEDANIRHILRSSWNNQNTGIREGKDRVASPFKAVNNLDDFLSRKNYVCGGSNQVNPSKPGWNHRIGSIMNMCDSSKIAGAVCNPKFVSDSSDYIKYKKQRAATIK